jgi:hypothetical protein
MINDPISTHFLSLSTAMGKKVYYGFDSIKGLILV